MDREHRPEIPIEIQRQVFREAGNRCAVCCEPEPLELAHIKPWNTSQDHSAENLVCLCANCHSRADKNPRKWGEKQLLKYKENPCYLKRKDAAPAPTEAATALASLHQIQPPPRDFTGREAEINELLEMLEHGGVTISGLHGLGGVGKTTLALKLAELLEGRYPDAQFYLDLKGPSTQPTPAADALAHVIRAYHPTAKLPESVDELRGQYLSVLHGQRALLLMDNARDEHQVEPLIPPPGCLLMVTSRFHFTVPGLKVKNLDALLLEDAVKLLLEIAPRISDQAADISRLCGRQDK